jgi:acetylornithine deacetylase/succinyl-diaminopimelate desuccinylase-like protein
MNNVIDFINTHRDRYIDELKGFLAIPSVSALPEHKDDVRKCAEWTADEMRRIGMHNVRLEETPGHPIVYGEWLGAPGAPTILFYGHYDVQPVDPLDLWESPPFEATVRDGEIYARGAVDDKGQVFMHFKAIEAHMKQNGKLPVNMKILLEGEEEVGSANLDEFVKASKDLLSADVVVISDSPMFDRGVPSICYGLRGLAYMQIDLRGTKSDLHSGSFGGAVANPNMVLAQVLAQMKDRGGRIKIPGFYDDVRELTQEERDQWKRLPFNEKRFAKELGAPKLFGESGYSVLERIWARPTLEVNGILRRLHRRGGQDRHPGRRDGEGQHAPRARPGPRQDREAVRGLREEDRAEDRRGEGHAHARREAVDGGVRQPVRPGRRPRDREGLRQGAGVQPRGRVDPGRVDVPGDPGPAVGALRHRPARPERARAEREDGPRNFHGGVIASAFLYEEIAGIQQAV